MENSEGKKICKKYKIDIDEMNEEEFIDLTRTIISRFNTPLTSIVAYMSLMMEGQYGKPSSEIEKALNKVKISAQKLIDFRYEAMNIVELYYKKKNDAEIFKKSSEKPKVFIFLGDIFLREIYSQRFIKNGFDALVFSNYDNVINNVVSVNPDIIMMDILVKGDINGYKAMEILKNNEKTKNTPLIVLSNLGEKEDIEKALRLGAEKYLIMAQYTPKEVIKIFKNYLIKTGKFGKKEL